jgi:hypothetical protein
MKAEVDISEGPSKETKRDLIDNTNKCTSIKIIGLHFHVQSTNTLTCFDLLRSSAGSLHQTSMYEIRMNYETDKNFSP